MDSMEAHLNKLNAASERLKASLIDPKGTNFLIDSLTNVINLFSNFAESIGGGKGLLLTLGSVGMQVFGDQIGNSLNTTINNLVASQQQVINLRRELQAIQKNRNSEDASKDPILQMVMDMRERLAKSTHLMTEDQINQAKKMIQDVADEYDKMLSKKDAY